MKYTNLILLIILITINTWMTLWNDDRNSSELLKEINNYQTTIDSLINKNERLTKGFLELYDDRSMMSIEMDKLIRNNKYLKRITR